MVDLVKTDKLRLQILRDLSSVDTLSHALRVEAWHRYADSEIPGGDALVMIGPVATMTTWSFQIDAAEARYFDGLADWLAVEDRDSDPIPPLLMLAGWEDIVRAERGTPTDLRATIPRAIAYFRDAVDWMLGDVDGRANFLPVTEFARELGQLKSRLEAVLHEGDRLDKGAPCMTCSQPLVKEWGLDEKRDRWHCRTCDQWSTVDQYRLAVKAGARAVAKALTATDMETEYRVSASTLRVWVHRGEVRKRGKNQSGRALYDVGDVLAKRNEGGP